MKHLFTLSERLKGRGRGSVTSAISATSASAIFCKLVGMVKLFMPFMKVTRRQSDTTIFAESLKSLKSLMSIFAESAESAESAKPIFANRGVKDVRVSLDQYPTNIQRISNLYLTPNRYLTRFAAVFALVFVLGVGNVLGATYTYDFTKGAQTAYWTSDNNNTSVGTSNIGSFYYMQSGYSGHRFTAGNGSTSTHNHKFNTNNNQQCFFLGQTGEYLTLPTYAGEKITNVNITIRSNYGSSAVGLNIYSNNVAVSTASTSVSTSTGTDFAINSSYQSSQLKVQVTNAKNAAITKIIITTAVSCNSWSNPTVNYSATTLTVGGAHATVSSITGTTYGAVSYASSNTSILTVNSSTGEVTPVSNGTAKVTVSWAGNSTYCAKDVDVNFTINNPPASITLNNYSGSATVTGYHVGDSFTLPSTNNYSCSGGKTFVGWSIVEFETTNTKPTSNFYEPGTSVTLEESNIFYAVFATQSDFTRVTDISQLGAGNVIVVVDNSNTKVLTTTPGYANAPTENAQGKITPDASMIWTLEASSSNWKLKTGGSYLGTTSTSNGTQVSLTPTNSTWEIASSSGATNTFYLRNTAQAKCCLEYNSSNPPKWVVYNNNSYTSSTYFTERLYVATRSAYSTTCCTPLAQVNGSVIVSQTPTSVQLSWNAVEEAEKYQVKVPGSTSHNDWTDVNTTSVEVTGLACGTAYTAHFRAIDTNGSHCAEGPESTLAIPAQSWTVTSTGVTNVTASPAIPSTTCNGFNTTITAATGYALPSEITVTNADKTWNSSTGALAISNVTGNVTITIAGTCITPKITANPEGAVYALNESSTPLSVTVEGAGDWCGYQWQSKVGTGAWTDIPSATNSSYTPSTASAGSTTDYRVIVSNIASGCSSVSTSEVATISVSSLPVCAQPTFSIAAGTKLGAQSVTLSCETEGAQIYYTTNGEDPQEISADLYNSLSIAIDHTTTIKAIAVKSGMTTSAIASATYTIKCKTPTFSVEAGTYNVNQSVELASEYGTVYYTTDGSDPATNGVAYSSAISVTASTTIRAIAKRDNCENSDEASAEYVLKCATPSFSVAEGVQIGAQNVTLTSTEGATIYYTTNGATPTTSSTLYEGAIAVSSAKTIKAIAVKEGWSNSDIASAAYTIKYTLTFQNNGETLADGGTKNLAPGEAYGVLPTLMAGDACDGTSTTFMGWSAEAIAEKTDVAPTFATAETTMGASDVVLHAVWAKAEGGGAAVNTVLWSEDFSAWNDGNEPSSDDITNSHTGTTVYGDKTLSYACVNGTSNTKLYGGNNQIYAGGSKPELLIGKNGGSFTVTGIPNGGASVLTISYKQNNKELTATVNGNGYSGSHTATPSSPNTESFDVTVASDADETFAIAFTSGTSDNVRLDDIQIKVKTQGTTYSDYITTCCEEWSVTASYGTSNVINVNDVEDVEIEGAAYGAATYESSNTAVLTVAADGKITGVKAGSAIVTIAWAGNADHCAYETSVDVTVNGPISVTYNANDGSDTPATKDHSAAISSNIPFALEANTFSRTGYSFAGWALTAGGDRAYDNSQPDVTLSENTVLYAKWNINSHAVTLTQPTGNTITATGAADLASVAYGTEITLSAEENDGYVFTGWDVTGATVVDANAKSTTFTMPDNDVAVSANYSTYNWISTGYSVTTDPKVAYTKVEKFSTAGVVIKENFKRSDNESLTKQEVYAGECTAKLNGEVIANGANLSLSDNGKTLILYIGEDEIESYTLTVSDIATDQFIDGLWGETFDPQIETYAMPMPSAHDAGSVAECKDHNIFVGWVEEANADEPTDENIIAGGTPGQTAANKTYYAVWAKQVEQDLPAGYRMVTEVPTTGTNVILAAKSGNKYYALTTDLEAQQLSFENGAITTSTSNLIFSYATADSKKVFKVGTNTYIHFNSSSFKVAQQTGNANVEITKVDDGAFKIKGTENTKYLTFSNEGNNPSFSTTSTEDDYSPIYIFKDQAASKILVNTDYITDCVTRYEISYNANGGEGSYESVKKKAGATVTLPDGEVLSKEHHDFAGWKADNVGELLNGGSEFTVGTANVAFYAQWSEWSKATVTFKNGEETVGTPAVVYRGENYTTPAAPVVAGKLFQGWSDGVNTYAAETEVAVPNDLTENITITYNALWKDVLPIPEAPAITAADLANGEWVLVTANSQIKEGDVVIVAKAAELNATSTIAMGNQHTDGSKVWREYESVEKSGNKITPKANVPMLFVQVGYGDNQYALYAINGTIGYLYDPQSSGNHYLNTGANLTTAASWTIAINANNEAEITNGASSKVLRYNAQNPRFSCYANGQQAVALYKWVKKISGDMDISNVTLTDAVIVEDGAKLTVDAASTLDNLTVEAGGKVETTNELTVINNLTIESEAGKSGQVSNAGNVHANNVYMDVTFYKTATELDATSANQWYMISAPFDVNLNGGFFQTDGTPMVFTVAAVPNSFDLFEYDGSKRASTGKTGWKRASGKMNAGVAYLIGFEAGQSTTIRLKAANTTMTDKEAITLNTYTSTIGTEEENEKNSNWNGVANPNLHYISINKDAQTYDNDARGYNPSTKGSTSYVVGTAFFIHGDEDASIVNTIHSDLRAPRRATEVQPIEFCVRLQQENASWANRMYIRASEEASAHYEAGHDLETMNGTNGNNALLWSNNYGMRLAIEEAPIVNDKASYALSLYAPADGTYRIETPTESDNADLYLTKDGRVIWNLSMGTYEAELTKGQNEGYGLLLVRKAPSVATGVEEPTSDSSLKGRATKVVIDEHVYILRGGQMYDVTGKAVK